MEHQEENIPKGKIQDVIEAKSLDNATSKVAEECMLDLCNQCDGRKRLTKLNDLFVNLSDAIIIFDQDLNILEANKLGKSFYAEFDTFVYGDQSYKLENLPVVQDVLKDHGKVCINVNSEDKGGQDKVFNICCSPTYSAFSEPTGLCMVISDVTANYRQVRQLEDMMASFTHDLKTPLIAAETNIRHLLEGQFGDINENQQRIMELMLSSCSNSLRLVKNLLSVFKYDTKSYRLLPKNIKARELVNNAIRIVESLLEDKDIKINTKLESDYVVYCDPFEIERVLTNLLSNSIKYSDEKNEIKIHVEDDGGFLRFSVEDKGFGIPQEKMSSLFNRFWQAKVYDSSTNGTGLGLYLSRQIVEAHGGTIWAESEEGAGTKVSFKLPSVESLIPDDLRESGQQVLI